MNYDELKAFVKTERMDDIVNEYSDAVGLMEDGTPVMIFDSWDKVNEFRDVVNETLGLLGEEDEELTEEDISDAYLMGKYSPVVVSVGSILGFTDEYAVASCCGVIVHTIPDYYGDLPDYIVLDGELICKKCMLEDKETYIDYIKNDYRRANTLLTDKELEDLGFKKDGGSYYNGFHHGMTDAPQKLLEIYENKMVDVIFSIVDSSQFYIEYEIWTRKWK